MSPVVQSARERVSPVREPWCPGLLPQEQGPIASNRPTTGTTLHDDRDEQPSRQGRDFLHVPHLSQYRLNGQTARTQAPKLPSYIACQHNSILDLCDRSDRVVDQICL